MDRHLPAPSRLDRTQRKAVSWQGPYRHHVENQDKPNSVTCQAGRLSPGGAGTGGGYRRGVLGPEQAAISSLTKVLSHLHPLESGLLPLCQCLLFREGFLEATAPLPKAQGTYCHPCPPPSGTTTSPTPALGLLVDVLFLHVAPGLISLCPPPSPELGTSVFVD